MLMCNMPIHPTSFDVRGLDFGKRKRKPIKVENLDTNSSISSPCYN